MRGLAGLSLVGGDIVEVAPLFDGPGQITALLAANLMFEFLCVLALQRRAIASTQEISMARMAATLPRARPATTVLRERSLLASRA